MKVNNPAGGSAMAASVAPSSPKLREDGVKPEEKKAGMNMAGKETVGDVANRVANSGKTSSRVVDGKGNPKLDKDAFFKLMLTHLKNQDPTSPLKSHEMAAQLAQFSSLEQMSNVSETLKKMESGQVNNGQYQALDLIGKLVSGDSSKIDHAQGDKIHSLSFNLPEDASEVKIAIKDIEGKVVKNLELKNQARGPVKFDWDGKNIDGKEQPAGAYKVQVEAKGASGNKLPVDMKFKGQVSGIQFTEKGPIVFVGNKSIPLKEIKQIEVQEEQKISNALPMMEAPPVMAKNMLEAMNVNKNLK